MSDDEAPLDDPTTMGKRDGPGHRKIKIALLIGYIGTSFHGSQVNRDPAHPTVEETLFEAICKAHLITEMNQKGDWSKKIGWQRASRTDKGVHALRNVINFKLAEPEGGIDAIPSLIQTHLCPTNQIRVHGALNVTRSFNCYETCTSRTYQYILPPYAVLGPEVFGRIPKAAEGVYDVLPEGALDIMVNHVPAPDHMARAHKLFQNYMGTKSFHNFTPKGNAADGSNTRYMMAADFRLSEVCGRPVILLVLHGQSFMLNQIRKMVSAVLCCVNEGLSDSEHESFMDKKVTREIPMLPANGLVLHSQEFGAYEAKLKKIQGNGQATDKPMIDFSRWDADVGRFSEEVMRSVLDFEDKERVLARWLLFTSVKEKV